MFVTLCVTLLQALASANVECVTVTPTARAERASAVGTRMAVPVLREGSAVGMDIANATAASAWTATTVPYVTSARAARHRARDTGEASGLAFGAPACVPPCGVGDHCPVSSLLVSIGQGLCRVWGLWDRSPGHQLQQGLCPYERDSGFGPYAG